jgi:uncharacterized membrane protein HdeD (DUF308 family)
MIDSAPTNEQMASYVGKLPWWLVLVWGILAVIIGLMLISQPLITAFLLITLMGVYWFVGGIFTLASLFSDKTDAGWRIFLAIISIIAGLVIMAYPIYSSIIVLEVLVFLIGLWALVIGGTHIYSAFTKKDAGSGVLGIISIIFGFILLIFPFGAAYALPIVAGVVALVAGLSAIVISFQVKKTQTP